MTEHRTTPWYRRGPDLGSLPPGRVPASHDLIGSADVPLRVFVRRRAWDEMQKFVETAAGQERGGILVGQAYEDDDGPFVVVTGAVPALHARPTPDGITFTQPAWDEMKKVVQYGFASELVVGWFHSHPGRGVFLSAYDRFTAHRFFPEGWQLTYVVDPVRQRQGLFYWRDGDLHPLPGFWVYHDDASAPSASVLAPAVHETVAAGEPAPTRAPLVQLRAVHGLMAVACLVLLVAAFLPLPGTLSSFNANIRDHAAETERLAGELNELRARHAVLQQAVVMVESPPATPAPSQPGSAMSTAAPGVDADTPDAPYPMSATETRSAAADDASTARGVGQAAPTETPSAAAPTETPSAAAPITRPDNARPDNDSPGPTSGQYVVRSGDTLWSISERLLGDPYAYARVARENRLVDPDLILPGWELLIPPHQGDAAAGTD